MHKTLIIIIIIIIIIVGYLKNNFSNFSISRRMHFAIFKQPFLTASVRFNVSRQFYCPIISCPINGEVVVSMRYYSSKKKRSSRQGVVAAEDGDQVEDSLPTRNYKFIQFENTDKSYDALSIPALEGEFEKTFLHLQTFLSKIFVQRPTPSTH